METTIIEEGICDIKTRLPLRKAIFINDGKSITRNLFILGKSKRRNERIDVIDSFYIGLKFSLEEINNLPLHVLVNKLTQEAILTKNNAKECYERNIKNEIPFFSCPIITINKTN